MIVEWKRIKNDKPLFGFLDHLKEWNAEESLYNEKNNLYRREVAVLRNGHSTPPEKIIYIAAFMNDQDLICIIAFRSFRKKNELEVAGFTEFNIEHDRIVQDIKKALPDHIKYEDLHKIKDRADAIEKMKWLGKSWNDPNYTYDLGVNRAENPNFTPSKMLDRVFWNSPEFGLIEVLTDELI